MSPSDVEAVFATLKAANPQPASELTSSATRMATSSSA